VGDLLVKVQNIRRDTDKEIVRMVASRYVERWWLGWVGDDLAG
jgi:hypothetical protein